MLQGTRPCMDRYASSFGLLLVGNLSGITSHTAILSPSPCQRRNPIQRHGVFSIGQMHSAEMVHLWFSASGPCTENQPFQNSSWGIPCSLHPESAE